MDIEIFYNNNFHSLSKQFRKRFSDSEIIQSARKISIHTGVSVDSILFDLKNKFASAYEENKLNGSD